MDIIANLPPTKAPVTRMGFKIVPFSYRCVFESMHFGLRIQMFAFSHNRLHRFRVNRR